MIFNLIIIKQDLKKIHVLNNIYNKIITNNNNILNNKIILNKNIQLNNQNHQQIIYLVWMDHQVKKNIM